MIFTLVLAVATSSNLNGSHPNPGTHEDFLRAVLAAHESYSNTPFGEEGSLQLDRLQFQEDSSLGGRPSEFVFRIKNSYGYGRSSVYISEKQVGSARSSSASILLVLNESLKQQLRSRSSSKDWAQQARENALLTLLQELGPWNSDPILTGGMIRFEYEGVPLDASISISAQYGELYSVTVQWPPADYEPLSWPLVSHEKIMSSLRNKVTLDPATQSVQLGFRLGYPAMDQEGFAKLTQKELDRRPSGIPFYTALLYTKTRHGATRVEGFFFSSLTGELLSGPVPFLGSSETQSLLPGIYTLPNGWKATLSPAQPPQSTSWQPTTLKNPNGDTLKAETDPNLRFYKINGTTYLRSRIPS